MNALSISRIFYILVLTAVSFLTVFAQTDFDDPKWTKFENKFEEFTVNLPNQKPAGGVARTSAEQLVAKYLTTHNKGYYSIFSSRLAEASVFTRLMAIATDRNTVPREIEIDGVIGKRYDFRGLDDYEHSLIAIQTPAHFYVFHVMGESRESLPADEFFGSIKFENKIEPLSTAAKVEEKTETPAASGETKPDFLSSLKKSPSSDLGGMRAGNPVEPTVAPPKYTKIESQVTILHRRNPAYTELAREFMINGMVKLRVTFEANSQIGDVRVLNKLPLGLTQNAMSAARDIRFSPALRNGEKYATTRVLEFNFNLY